MLLYGTGRSLPSIQHVLRSTGYFTTFVLGVLYVYSFTALPATALLLIICKTQDIWMASAVATTGAVMGDLILFSVFRRARYFADDRMPSHERYTGWWRAVQDSIPPAWQRFALMILVVAILALPLPNELADFFLARMRKVGLGAVVAISCLGNGLGLCAIVWLARLG